MAIKKPEDTLSKPELNAVKDEGEESDEYEVGDDEGEIEEGSDEEEEGDEEEGGGLTALLLGGSVGGGDDDGEDTVWVPDGGKEPADYSGEEGEDDEENTDVAPQTSQKTPTKNNIASPSKTSSGGKKRTRDGGDEPDKEARKEKKAKGN